MNATNSHLIVRTLIKCGLLVLSGCICLYVLLGNRSFNAHDGRENLPPVDSCEIYRLIVLGNESADDYDSIRQYLRKTMYNSKLLEQTIFFDQGHSNSPGVYLHAKLQGGEWELRVVCNDFNLDETIIRHLLEVSSDLIVMIRKEYKFDRIYFHCSILDR